MNEIILKSCPFCGGGAVVHVDNGVRVICKKMWGNDKMPCRCIFARQPNWWCR